MTQSSFDQSDPSVVPSKHLFRTQAIIETLLGSEKIRQPSEFLHFSVAEGGFIRLRLIRHRRIERIPPRLKMSYAGVNHAIAAND
jgi:hypothetical protein